MPKAYVIKPVPADPYRIDGRATMNVPLHPTTSNIQDGPTVFAISGVRVNDDTYPSGS